MPRIYQRNKVWYLDYFEKGKRVRRRVSENRRVAEHELRELLRRRRLGRSIPKSEDFPITDLRESFLSYSETNNRAPTTTRYRQLLAHFERFCKYESLESVGELRLEHSERYKAWRKRQGAAPRTINHELNTVSAALNYAVRLKRLPDNPWSGFRKLPVTRKAPRVYSLEEIENLVAALPGWAADAIVILVYSGMRYGELRNLRWADVDLRKGWIRIQSREDWATKTGEHWSIPIAEPVAGVLRRRRRVKGRPEWVVWTPRSGKQLAPNHLREMVQRKLRKLKLPDGTIHDLRHTFASWMIEAGAGLSDVQSLMGHRDYRTTERYRHLSPEHLRESVKRLPVPVLRPRPAPSRRRG